MIQSETLNIDYWIGQLCVKALNKYPTKRKAAGALGISVRNLYRFIDNYRIHRNPKKRIQYYIVEKTLRFTNPSISKNGNQETKEPTCSMRVSPTGVLHTGSNNGGSDEVLLPQVPNQTIGA